MTGILDMTLEGLGEMFRGYSTETCAGKFSLVPMGVRAESPACAGRGARPPSALAEFVLLRLHTESQLPGLTGSLRVCLEMS